MKDIKLNMVSSFTGIFHLKNKNREAKKPDANFLTQNDFNLILLDGYSFIRRKGSVAGNYVVTSILVWPMTIIRVIVKLL